ncbi:venom protein 302-like [Centruroides vittatus]|uniref:venom protein 302-like n=1 Tax=Centruroides vittatus TaxID=120091 RepID=UPI003510838A
MASRLSIFIVLLSGLLDVGRTLTCIPCEEATCINKTEEECPVGVVYNTCGCCKVCAKNIGEVCDGPYKVYGQCGRGLICVKPSPPPGIDSFLHYFNIEGICQVNN